MLKGLFKNISARQIVLKNVFWIFFSQIVIRVLKFFLVIYIAKSLGPSGYGSFQYIFSILGLIYIFGDLGINNILIRDFQKKDIEKEKFLSVIEFLNILLELIFLFLSLLVFFIVEEKIKITFLILSFFFFFQNIKNFIFSLLKALNKMEIEAIILILENLWVIILAFLLLKKWPQESTLALAYLGASVISFIISFLYIKKIIVKPKIDLNYAKKIIINSLPFVLGGISGYILTNTDILMIKWFWDEWSVGQYTIGVKVFQFLLLIAFALTTASFPLLASKKESPNISKRVTDILWALLYLGVPLALGGFLLKERLILRFFGNQYFLSPVPFGILMLSIPFAFLIIFLGNILFIYNLQLKYFAVVFLASILNIVLNFLVIPKISIIGAALTTFICNVFTFILLLKIAAKLNLIFLDRKKLKNIILANFLNTILVIFLMKTGISSILIVIVSVLFYFFVLKILKEKLIEEIQETLKEIMSVEKISPPQESSFQD